MLYPCCWYLETTLIAADIRTNLCSALKEGDSLVVVDATNREAAWKNISEEGSEHMKQSWGNGGIPEFQSPASPKLRRRGESRHN
jgi:hypothetical protein